LPTPINRGQKTGQKNKALASDQRLDVLSTELLSNCLRTIHYLESAAKCNGPFFLVFLEFRYFDSAELGI
jgi:hypothetical protein